jgi:adenine phosphoribosyltransferase
MDPDQGAVDTGALIASLLRDVPDYPSPGIVFKDLTPLLADGSALRAVTDAIVAPYLAAGGYGFDIVAGIEARGFILAGAIGYAHGVGMTPVRKAGKLPRATHQAAYALEYGEAVLEVHTDAFSAGQRVLIVDDVLATGGTAEAAANLVERAGGTVAGISVLLELGFLGGRAKLAGRTVHSLLTV